MLILIIFAIISLILFLKLWEIIGVEVKVNKDKKNFDKKTINLDSDDVIDLTKFYSQIEKIKSFNKDFSVQSFLDLSKGVFKEITTAYFEGNLVTLEKLVSNDLFLKMQKSIENRGAALNMELNLIESDIDNIVVSDNFTEISVWYKSRQRKDDMEEKLVLDLWTFGKNLQEKFDNEEFNTWKLIRIKNN